MRIVKNAIEIKYALHAKKINIMVKNAFLCAKVAQEVLAILLEIVLMRHLIFVKEKKLTANNVTKHAIQNILIVSNVIKLLENVLNVRTDITEFIVNNNVIIVRKINVILKKCTGLGETCINIELTGSFCNISCNDAIENCIECSREPKCRKCQNSFYGDQCSDKCENCPNQSCNIAGICTDSDLDCLDSHFKGPSCKDHCDDAGNENCDECHRSGICSKCKYDKYYGDYCEIVKQHALNALMDYVL